MVFSLLNLEENLDNFILTDELNALLPLSWENSLNRTVPDMKTFSSYAITRD